MGIRAGAASTEYTFLAPACAAKTDKIPGKKLLHIISV